ncbi:ABC transporter permease [Clostridiales bacterium]|nr:ABC transporter permease [Clostridiales bacterium]
MMFFEAKKVFSKPINKAAIAILAAVLVIASFLTIRDVTYVTSDGNHISGIKAAGHLQQEKSRWAGDLTEDVLKKVIQENAAIASTKEAKSEDWRENEKAFAKKQGFNDIRDMISEGFSPIENYDYNTAEGVSEKEVGELYQRRLSNLKIWLDSEDMKGNFTENEKKYIIDQYENLKTPLYYEYADGWKALMDSQYLLTLVMITLLVLGFLVSGIFSDEFSLKADAIFFSARLGRGKAIRAKMGAGFFIVTIIYWGTLLIYALIVLGVLGFGGGECAVQTGDNWLSLYNISYIQDFLITATGGYIGSLFILTLAMLISAKTRSTVFAITVPFALTCVAPFMQRVAIFAPVMKFFPDQLLALNKSLDDFMVHEIGGVVFSAAGLLIPLYLMLFFVIFPALYWVYQKTQVK